MTSGILARMINFGSKLWVSYVFDRKTVALLIFDTVIADRVVRVTLAAPILQLRPALVNSHRLLLWTSLPILKTAYISMTESTLRLHQSKSNVLKLSLVPYKKVT